jgi:hypothetical protein
MKKVLNNVKLAAQQVEPIVTNRSKFKKLSSDKDIDAVDDAERDTNWYVTIVPKPGRALFLTNFAQCVNISYTDVITTGVPPHLLAGAESLRPIVDQICSMENMGGTYTACAVNAGGIAVPAYTQHFAFLRKSATTAFPGASHLQLKLTAHANDLECEGMCKYCQVSTFGVQCSGSCSTLCCHSCSASFALLVGSNVARSCACGGQYLYNLPTSIICYHEAYMCGHDFKGVAQLMSLYATPSSDKLTTHMMRIISEVARIVVTNVLDGNCTPNMIEFPSFGNPDKYPNVFPKKSSIGMKLFARAGMKKQDIEHLVKRNMLTCHKDLTSIATGFKGTAEELQDELFERLEQTYSLANKANLKVEVKPAKINYCSISKPYRPAQPAARIFQCNTFEQYFLGTMLTKNLHMSSGLGTHDNNKYDACGLRMHGSGESLLRELFGDDWNKPEAYLLEHYHIIHGDYSKFDLHVRHHMLGLTLGMLLSVLRCGEPGTVEYAVNKAYRDFYVATMVEKIQQDPHTGTPYFVAGTMPSGTSNTTGANGMVNAVQLFTAFVIMNGHIPLRVVIKSIRLKTYGDDWILVCPKKINHDGNTLNFNVEPAFMSKLMLRMFNMEISPEEIHVCTKLFSNELTIDLSAPVFLQFQFREIYVSGKVCRILWRPWRPGPASKIFNSSDGFLNKNRLASRLIVFAMFAVDKRIYHMLEDCYNYLRANCPDLEPEEDGYVEEKIKQLQLDPSAFVDFPTYEYVIELHTRCVQFGARDVIMPWDKYHEKHDVYVPVRQFFDMLQSVY